MNTIGKYKTRIGIFLNGIAMLAGIIIGLLGLRSEQISDRVLFYTILISFAIVSLCSVFVTLYYYHTKRKTETHIQESNEEISKMLEKHEDLQKQISAIGMAKNVYVEKVTQFMKNINKTLSSQQMNLYAETENYLGNIGDTLEVLFTLGVEQGINLDKHIAKNMLDQKGHFEKAIFGTYNRFLGRMVNDSKDMVEFHIATKKYPLDVSVSFKMLNEPFRENLFDDGVFVFTAFRDKVVYEEKNREIGQKRYSIQGNTDFTQCTKREEYIRNNVQRTDSDYQNEHRDFDNYYNCTVTVPIIYGGMPNETLFGYLCCDTLNNGEYAGEEIFDREVANILFAVATNIGIFLNQACAVWDESFNLGNNFTMYVYHTLSQRHEVI